MIYRIQYFFTQCAISLITSLPFSIAASFAKTMGSLFYFCVPRRKKIACENLDKAYGDSLTQAQKETLARRSFQSTALSLLELIAIPNMRKKAAQCFDIKGLEHFEAALARGKGAVLVTSHLGSWEYLEFLFYLTGIHCSVIVKSVKNPYLNRKIDELRRETTVIPIPKVNAIREVLAVLKNNQVAAILVDQWAGSQGMWGDFFGVYTSTTSLPARLARKTGCALVPAYCLRKGLGKYEIQVHAPLILGEPKKDEEAAVTQELNKLLEKQILKYPEQWSWAHRRWKKKPKTSRA